MLPLDNPLFWILGFVGVVLTGISKSGLAGGAGVLAVPLFALVVDVPVAAAITLPLLWLMDIKTIWAYRGHIDAKLLLALCPAALVGVAIAGYFMSVIDSSSLVLLLGILSLVFAAWQDLARWLSRWSNASVIWGGLAGFSSTLLHAGGPPLSIYLLGRDTKKEAWLGTAAAFFGVLNVVKAIPYTINEQWSVQQWWVSLSFIPVAWFGVWLGIQLAKMISQSMFTAVARSMLALAGVMLIFRWWSL